MDFSIFENMHSKPETDSVSTERTRFPEHMPLAMAYVPLQQWGETYDLEKGFNTGTIFPELNFPFEPEVACYDPKK